MFIPLLHYRTKFDVYSTLSAEEFSRHLFKGICEDLDNAYMRERWQHKCDYEFKGTNYRFIWNGFNKFNGIKKGVLHIDKEKGEIIVTAKYEFAEVFFLCMMFSLIPILDFWGPKEWRVILIVAIWFIYLVNFIISYKRLNNYFKRAVLDTFITYDRDRNKKLF